MTKERVWQPRIAGCVGVLDPHQGRTKPNWEVAKALLCLFLPYLASQSSLKSLQINVDMM
jgi:hypothetical protein